MMEWQPVVDALRGLSMLLGAICLGLMLNWVRKETRHVHRYMGAFGCLLVAEAIWEHYTRHRTGLTVRIPLNIVAFSFGIKAFICYARRDWEPHDHKGS